VFTGGTNYNDQSGDVSITINKATASITVTPYNVTYDGAAHTATATATGVGGVNLIAQLTLSGTTHTNAGTYNGDAWSFAGGTNYNDANGTVNDKITKADATVSVTGYTGVYDAVSHGATGTATGVNGANLNGSLNLGATFTDVPGGTAHWVFTGGTNYNDASGTAAIVITKATATVVVNGYSGVYDAAAHGASGSATGVGGVNLNAGLSLGATFTNVPGGAASWSFNGGTNYNNASGIAAIVITKADPTVVVTPYNVTYDGNNHSAAYTITGVNGETGGTVGTITLNTTHKNAGTYSSDSWSFTGATNYKDIASTTITDVITKAPLTVLITAPSTGALFPSNPATNFQGTVGGLVAGESIGFTWTFDGQYPASGMSSGSSIAKSQTLAAGVYQLSLTVNPGGADGNYTTATTTNIGSDDAYVVIYDPNGGFVTGGGWIMSPANAYQGNSPAGKANFGFVSKYAKGANIPTGETEFQFQAGNLNFKSTVYEWLVVSGAKAQYKGSGTINGVAGFKFLLTATDGQVNGGGGVDKFRIKITNSLDTVVYDNVQGGTDDIDTANPQALGGGSIVIHSK
jgi:hypothetical protein